MTSNSSSITQHLEVLSRTAEPDAQPRTGFAVMISMVSWLDELLGSILTKACLRKLEGAQAGLLEVLQHDDDVRDGQSKANPHTANASLGDLRRSLETVVPAGSPFWTALDHLERGQEASALWEDNHRGRSLPFDDALIRALAGKGALLRWPAWALPEIAGQSERAAALDALSERFLGVTILFDDLHDFEEDWERGQVNAVLCAGGVHCREPVHFYGSSALGARLVCKKAHDELLQIAAEAPGSGLARFCLYRASRCKSIAAVIIECCRVRSLDHVLRQVLKPTI